MATTTSTLDILLRVQNQTGQTLQNIQAQLLSLQTALGGVSTAAGQSNTQLAGIGSTLAGARAGVTGFVDGLKSIAQAAAGLYFADKIKDGIKSIAEGAARTQVLGTVLREIGKASGYTTTEIDKLEKSVQKMGITVASSRESLTKMIQAGLDVTKAAELARAAQNFAVIAGEDSSSTLTRIITNIQQLDTMGLRFMGVVISMDEVTARYATSIGKTSTELSQAEKQQALMNEIIKKGAESGGLYVAAMGDVGKQVQSLARYEKEYSDTLGTITLPAYSALVVEYTTFLKQAGLMATTYDQMGTSSGVLADVTRALASAVRSVAVFFLGYKDVIILAAAAYAVYTLATLNVVKAGAIRLVQIAATIAAMVGEGIATVALASIQTAAIFTVANAARVGRAAVALFWLAASGPVGWAVAGFLALGAAIIAVSDTAQDWIKSLFSPPTEAGKASQEAIKRINDSVEQLVDLQPELAAAEAKVVEARKAGSAVSIEVAEREFEVLKAKEKALNAIRIKGEEDKEAARKRGLSSADKAAEEEIAKQVKLKKAYEELEKAVSDAKRELKIPNSTEGVKDGVSQVQVLSQSYNTAAGAVRNLVSMLELSQRTGQKSTASIADLRIGLVSLGEAASNPDEIASAMRQISEASAKAGIDSARLLSSLQVKLDSSFIKQAEKDISGFSAKQAEAVSVVRNLSSVLDAQSKDAQALKEVLASLGVNSLDSLSKLQVGTSTAFGALALGADTVKSKLREMNLVMLQGIDSQVAASRREYDLEISNIESIRRAKLEVLNLQAPKLANTDQSAGVSEQRVVADALRARESLAKRTVEFEKLKATAIDAINKETYQKQVDASKKYLDLLSSQRSKLLSDIQANANKIIALDEETFQITKSRDEQLRTLKQKGMSEDEIALDNSMRITTLAYKEQEALAKGQIPLAKELNEQRKSLVDGQVSSAKTAGEVATAELNVNKVYNDRIKIQDASKQAAIDEIAASKKRFDEIGTTITSLQDKIKGLTQEQVVRLKFDIDDAALRTMITNLENALRNANFSVNIKGTVVPGNAIAKADGGMITGPGTGTSDSIPAWLSNGEFVNQAKSVAYYGSDLFKSLNSMSIPRSALKFATGGLVPTMSSPRFASGGQVGGSGPSASKDTVNISLNVGGERLSLFGERQQANKLVSALKRMEFGT